MDKILHNEEYRICATCKKVFSGDYIWKDYAYKIDNKYYCGWECFRKAQNKTNKKFKNNVIK